MKHLLLLLICIISMQVQQLQAQVHDSAAAAALKNSYLIKSKSQKTTAWVLLGVGVAAIAVGIITENAANNTDNIYSGVSDVATGVIITGIGALSCIASIPFFISSGKNKKRAMSVTSGFDEIMTPAKGGWAYNMQPAIKIIIPIGR